TVNPDADLFISFTASSIGGPGSNPPPIFPQVAVATIPVANESSGVPDAVDFFPLGLQVDYVNGKRWGDYSAAVTDPMIPGDIWVTAEYSRSSLVGITDRSWGTATTEVAESPQVTSITPSTGPATGGQLVTITGSSFERGATVDFGGHLATNVVVAPGGGS